MKKGWFGIFLVVVLVPGLIGACLPKKGHQPLSIAQSPKDPALIHGTLPNGFQYLVMRNTTPTDRVSVHLNVFSGSAHEQEGEQGLAHFLEHMLFNGSEHFKPGELIDYFQSIGMDFGADANARTSFFSTIYDLDLPKGDKPHLDDAFLVIRDYAGGALLLPEEVDRERGVILAEKRERDSVSFRTFKQTLAFEMPGSLLADRLPIGTAAALETADRQRLKAYYDQWYRPDNMALVVVGDLDPDLAVALIRENFSSLPNRSAGPSDPPDISWTPHKGLKTFYLHEPEAGKTEITLERIEYLPFEPDSIERTRQRARAYLGDYMLGKRYSRMIREQTADFSSASAYTGQYLKHVFLAAVQADSEPGKWEKSLMQLENSLRQALTYGFTAQELDRAKADYIASLESAAAGADTRKSGELAGELLSALNRNGLFISPAQRLDLLSPYISSLTLEGVNEAFRAAWDADHRLVLVTGNAVIEGNPDEAIALAYTQAQQIGVLPYQAVAARDFPYLDVPKRDAGIVAHERNVKELGIDQITFGNHVRLNLKPTAFKKGEFSFKAVLGQGLAGMPVEMAGLSDLAESTVSQSGFGRMGLDQLQAALAGRDVSIGFKIKESYFSIEGTAAPDEAELVFQLLFAYLNDPGFRPQGLALAKTRYRQAYEALERTPDGIMKIRGNRFLAGNDPAFGLAHPDQADQLDLEQIASWLRPVFAAAPLEVSMVGDFDPKVALDLAVQYLGPLDARDAYQDLPEKNISFPQGQSVVYTLDTKIDKGMVRVAFPTDDFWDITRTRQLSVLSRVMSERLRKEVREALGASYSPYVHNQPSVIHKGYGVMSAVIKTDPDQADLIYGAVAGIVKDIRENGVTEEELGLVIPPIMTHLAVLRQSNGYWLNSVLADSARHPERLDWSKHLISGYQNITPADLSALARQYLDMKKSARILIQPQ